MELNARPGTCICFTSESSIPTAVFLPMPEFSEQRKSDIFRLGSRSRRSPSLMRQAWPRTTKRHEALKVGSSPPWASGAGCGGFRWPVRSRIASAVLHQHPVVWGVGWYQASPNLCPPTPPFSAGDAPATLEGSVLGTTNRSDPLLVHDRSHVSVITAAQIENCSDLRISLSYRTVHASNRTATIALAPTDVGKASGEPCSHVGCGHWGQGVHAVS